MPSMTEREKKLFKIFKDAVEAERGAQVMYQQAIELCDDPNLKKMLTGMCADEERHEKEVMNRYQQFRLRYLPEDGLDA